MSQVRLAAARVLLGVEAGHTTLATALDRALPAHTDRRDRGLLVEVATGVMRWRNELDAVIAHASRRNVGGLDTRVRTVLRLGAYQLRHLDRVPSYAVVHDSVNVIRTLGATRAAGFVNAVLRALARGEGTASLPPRPQAGDTIAAQLAYLTTTLSHPAWLAERWIARYGFDAATRWCEFNNASPVITIRSRGQLPIGEIAARLAGEQITSAPAPFVRDALRLPPASLGRVSPDLRAELRVQDEGSQIVARLVGAEPGQRVLDVCAAPGGKTLVLASDMSQPEPSSTSLLVAGDRRPARLRLLADTLRSAGFTIPIVGLDAEGPLPFGAIFDRVLLDAPCSGLGTLRRDPDLKWMRTPEDLPRLAAVARGMLARAAEVVRPGGRLVYATCSSEPDENIEVVWAFLAADARFTLASAAPSVAAELIDSDGCLSTTPAQHGLDAFFGAVLVRREGP